MNPPDHQADPDATVDEAFAIMKREHIRHLLVMGSDDELVGVVTDRDLRRPSTGRGDVLSVREMYLLGDELRVRDVMSDQVVTVEPDETTCGAAQLMVKNQFNCLPVMRGDRVVGIVTSTDLLAALVRAVDPMFADARAAEAC